MADLALPGPKRRARVLRGLALILAGLALAVFIAFASPHVIGALYYLPKLDRLFAELHRDPVLIDALRQQNARLADKDDAWTLAQDREWSAERQKGGGPLQEELMARAASAHLRDIVTASDGLVSHAFLM